MPRHQGSGRQPSAMCEYALDGHLRIVRFKALDRGSLRSFQNRRFEFADSGGAHNETKVFAFALHLHLHFSARLQGEVSFLNGMANGFESARLRNGKKAGDGPGTGQANLVLFDSATCSFDI
ncbi:unnamed protein product [Sphagnum balticum]